MKKQIKNRTKRNKQTKILCKELKKHKAFVLKLKKMYSQKKNIKDYCFWRKACSMNKKIINKNKSKIKTKMSN